MVGGFKKHFDTGTSNKKMTHLSPFAGLTECHICIKISHAVLLGYVKPGHGLIWIVFQSLSQIKPKKNLYVSFFPFG
jgi:hypothetical protein